MFNLYQGNMAARQNSITTGHDRFAQIRVGSKRRNKFLNRKAKSTNQIDEDVLKDLRRKYEATVKRTSFSKTKCLSISLDNGINNVDDNFGSQLSPLGEQKGNSSTTGTNSIGSMVKIFKHLATTSKCSHRKDSTVNDLKR